MNNFVNFIVKQRYLFLAVFFVLLVGSAIAMSYVNINYDLTKYLPNDSQTKQSIELMEQEFGASGTASIMITDIEKEDAQAVGLALSTVDKVSACVVSNYSVQDKAALISIFLEYGDYTQEAEQAINGIEKMLQSLKDSETLAQSQTYYLTGSAVSAIASRTAISNEIPVILLIAVAIVLIVLFITTRSWIEPFILLMVIGTAILINYGTNIILGSISFISNSISAVLLIALAMDYSIVLVSRLREEREKTDDVQLAMKKAIAGSMTTIIASGLTVMAGLLSLVFMQYTIGMDMGIVLTKGVFISILAVIFLMPALLLLFAKAIVKTEHKSFLPGLKHIGTFAKKTRFVIPAIFVALLSVACVIQFKDLQFDYVAKMGSSNSQAIEAEQQTEKVFGVQNALVVIIPNYINDESKTASQKEQNIETQKNILQYIATLKIDDKQIINTSSSFLSQGQNGLTLGTLLSSSQLQQMFGLNETEAGMILSSTQTCSSTPNTAYTFEILKTLNENPTIKAYIHTYKPELEATIENYYNAMLLANAMFNSTSYTRMIFNINANIDSEPAIKCLDEVKNYLNNTSVVGAGNYYIVNNTQNAVETKEVFTGDRLRVELISALAILLIVLLATRSVSIPVILVLAIEGAIWINLAGNAIIGNSIFFICYLLGTAIQMGATIDYGILLTDRYTMARKKQNKFDAIKTAIDKSFTTIISSGSILTFAAFTIGIVSTVPLISSIGYLVGFGALCATITMLFVLPQCLLLCDKIICKTTRKANFIYADNYELKNIPQNTNKE